jgi:hypothetical protein
MQKVIVRKLKLETSTNNRNYMTGKTSAANDCASFESIIQQEIDDGWKIVNVSTSYDVSWHCNIVVFVLEKNVIEEDVNEY